MTLSHYHILPCTISPMLPFHIVYLSLIFTTPVRLTANTLYIAFTYLSFPNTGFTSCSPCVCLAYLISVQTCTYESLYLNLQYTTRDSNRVLLALQLKVLSSNCLVATDRAASTFVSKSFIFHQSISFVLVFSLASFVFVTFTKLVVLT